MYANIVYYGSGATGIQNASHCYFKKDAADLSLEESAMLAGLLQAPSAHNPVKNPDKARERQQTVLAKMKDNGFIAPKAKKSAVQELIEVKTMPAYILSCKANRTLIKEIFNI